MFKKLHLLFYASICTLCSCTDEMLLGTETAEATNDVATTDLTGGYNVLLLDGEKASNSYVPLGNNGNVKYSSENKAFSYEKVIKDGKPMLKVSFSGDANDILEDELTVTDASNPDNKKSVVLIVRPNTTSATSRGTLEMDAEKRIKGSSFLGCATHPLSQIQNFKRSVFNTSLLQQYAGEDDWKQHFEYNDYKEGHKKLDYSYDASSHMQSKAWKAGLDLNIPIKKVIVNLSASYHGSVVDNNAESREFTYFTQREVRSCITLNKSRTGKLPYLWAIDSLVNDWLNNPASESYTRDIKDTLDYDGHGTYERGQVDIFRFIDMLGGYQFNTSVVMGGEVTAELSRKKTMSSHSTSWGVDVALKISKAPKDPTENEEYYKKFNSAGYAGEAMFNAMGASKPSAGVSGGYSDQERKESLSMDFKLAENYHGGVKDASNKSWSMPDNDVSTWVPLCFSDKDYYNHMEERGTHIDNTEIHSILDLMTDTNSKRYQLIKQAITPDKDGIIPYYVYRHCYADKGQMKIIVADATLQTVRSNTKYPVFMFCDRYKKTLPYYPLVTNYNVNSIVIGGWIGKVIPLQDKEFTGCDLQGDKLPLTVLVAYDWINKDSIENDNRGITDIWIDKDDKADPLNRIFRRGLWTDRHVDGDPKGGANYLYVQYAEKGVKSEDRITGVSVYLTKWDGDNSPRNGHVIASSACTDMISCDSENTNYFNKYWNPDDPNLWVRGEDVHSRLGSIVDMQGKSRPHTAQIGYTKKEIEREFYSYPNGVKKQNFLLPQPF